jgi:hypothetical protein
MPLYEKPHDPKMHKMHLCQMVVDGTTLYEYSKLVSAGNFVCKQCGRVANTDERLCEPVDLRRIK